MVNANPRVAALSLILAGVLFGLLPILFQPKQITFAYAAPDPVATLAAGSNCGALPAPNGNIIHVDPAQASNLDDIVRSAASGDTILLTDGTYNLQGDYLWFDVPGVTLRSASGNRNAVILDGNYQTTEIVYIVASNVTIADLTIKRAKYHPLHVTASSNADTENTLIYNVHVIDAGQQAIKINQNVAKTHFPDNGTVACSHLELTDAGRPQVWAINGSCYTGGIDGHQAWGWIIRDNLIEGFWCDQGLSEHAIHFWTGSRDTLVERNVLIDNARGVGFGLGQSGNWRTYEDDLCSGVANVGHYDGVIRNNFVFQDRAELQTSQFGFDCGICLEQACGAKALHNTVVSTALPFSSIEWRFSNTSAEIINNLVSHNLRARDGAAALLTGNLSGVPLSMFVDGAGGDLHLLASAGSAIDQGYPGATGMSSDDIDGALRDAAPDIGADEYLADFSYGTYLPLVLKPL
jgi:hypothetical protein